MSARRNTAVEALRFLFMLQICVWHYGSGFGTMQAGFLGVEFFFILSGFFLYRSATKPDAPGIIDYTVRKLSKFYPAYVIVVVFSYFFFARKGILLVPGAPVDMILKFIGQILMIQDSGAFYHGINNVLWFFTVLVYGGAIVYGLVRYYTKVSIRVLFPIICLLFFGYIFNYGEGTGFERWEIPDSIPYPMIRGMVEIAYGTLLGYMYFNHGHSINKHLTLVNVASVCAVLLYIPVVFITPGAQAYVLILFPVLLVAAFTSGTLVCKVFSGEIWLRLGHLSFDMYLIHLILIHGCVKYLPMSETWSQITYLLILIPAAWAFQVFVRRLTKKLSTGINNRSKENSLSGRSGE